jgi:heme/copper-type cytochrome/quinol oxidase subunit 2
MEIYPQSPNLDQKLTKLPFSYYAKVGLAILSILLFFVLYFAFIYFLVKLCYWSIMYPMVHINKLTILGKVGAVAGSIMLLIFSLKFIFKLKNHKPTNRIKLSKKEYPKIWSFILKVVKKPKHRNQSIFM